MYLQQCKCLWTRWLYAVAIRGSWRLQRPWSLLPWWYLTTQKILQWYLEPTNTPRRGQESHTLKCNSNWNKCTSLTACCYLSPGPILFWTSTLTQLLFWAWTKRPLMWTKSGTDQHIFPLASADARLSQFLFKLDEHTDASVLIWASFQHFIPVWILWRRTSPQCLHCKLNVEFGLLYTGNNLFIF